MCRIFTAEHTRWHAEGMQEATVLTVGIPTRDDDEFSFLRLVVWSYVLVQETGRVALRFLKELPPFRSVELVPEVVYLRTWATHNLSPDRDSDKKKLKLAWAWLKESCESSAPTDALQWRACFKKLCDAMGNMLSKALDACEALDSKEDGPRLLAELRRRVDRDWEAYRFDEFVTQATQRLGYEGLDVVEFRRRHLDAWRKIVAVADDGAIDRLLIQRIEKDLLDLMANALSVTASELIAAVPFHDPRELAAFMLWVRQRAALSSDSIVTLLDDVARELNEQAKGTAPTLHADT